MEESEEKTKSSDDGKISGNFSGCSRWYSCDFQFANSFVYNVCTCILFLKLHSDCFIIAEKMAAWKDLFVPKEVLQALCKNKFFAPTPIQAMALPSAIRDKKDVVGAAETVIIYSCKLFSQKLMMKK